MAGFKSVRVAGFKLECLAGFVGIRTAAPKTQMPMVKSIRAAETAIDKWYEHAKIAA
jgi:hypothetical protein